MPKSVITQLKQAIEHYQLDLNCPTSSAYQQMCSHLMIDRANEALHFIDNCNDSDMAWSYFMGTIDELPELEDQILGNMDEQQ